jgi:arsenate reductase (thioredoxin)
MMRVLILCTGNSARSQMAEGLLRHLGQGVIEVESAGTNPSVVRPEAILALDELGIDIRSHRSKHVAEFDGVRFDEVITVCDSARENCPVVFGAAKLTHHSFPDPAGVAGSHEDKLNCFRDVRDQIAIWLREHFRDVAPGRGAGS